MCVYIESVCAMEIGRRSSHLDYLDHIKKTDNELGKLGQLKRVTEFAPRNVAVRTEQQLAQQ